VLLSGGAPLAPATHEYLKTVLCIQILQVHRYSAAFISIAPLAPATHEYLKTVLCIQILQVLQTVLRIRIRSDPKLFARSG
jgi:hypothetical protein